jgi:hypothetical protein
MRKIKNKHRKRTDHLFAKAVLRMLFFQYTGKRISPHKIETWCWLDRNRRGRLRFSMNASEDLQKALYRACKLQDVTDINKDSNKQFN